MKPATAPLGAPATAAPASPRPRVLLVDGRPASLLTLEAALEPLGARLVCAGTGREALERAAAEDFAAILLDVELPDLSGLQVAARLREHGLNRRTPVLLVTAGDVGETQLLEGCAHGAVDFLRKPFVPAVLQAKVSVFLELYLARETVRAQEAQLREREREALGHAHLALLQQAPAAIAILRGEALTFEFTNTRYEQVVGRTGLVGKPLLQALPEIASQPAVLQALEGVLRTGRTFFGSEFAVQLQRGEGSALEEAFFNLIYQALREPDGQVGGIVAFAVDVTDQVHARRRAESLAEDLGRQSRALHESEERLRLALDATGLGTWDMDGPTGAMRLDARCKTLFGLPPEAPEVDLDTAISAIHPADRAAAQAAIQACLRPGSSGHFDMEYRIVGLQDGLLRWVRATGHARFEGERLVRFTGAIQDISAHKRLDAERAAAAIENARLLEAVRAERSNLQELLMQMPVAATVLRGPSLVLELCNAAAQQIVGRPLALGVPIRQLFPELEGQGFFELLESVYRTGETVEAREMRARLRRSEEGPLQECVFDIRYQALRAADGRIDGVVSFATEVSAQVQARERMEALAGRLRESEERFRTLAEAMPQLVWAAGPDGTHDYFNQRFLDYTGTQRGHGDTDTWLQSMHVEDRAKALERWRQSVATGEPFEIEYRRLRADGEWRWLLGRALPVRDAQGSILRWLGTSTDIEEQIRTRRELEATQARLARTARHNALMADVGVHLTRAGVARDLLQGCTEALVRHLDAAFARIWLLDAPAQVLRLQASAGIYTHLNGAHASVPVGKFKIGLIAQERAPHLTNDVLNDPRVGDPEWARREGMVAFAGYPLMVGEQVVGVMALFSRKPLPEETLETLRTASDTLALGIQRLWAEEQVRALNQGLEQRVRERTLQLQEINRELESFSYSVSHDLRAPLRHVTGFAQLLQKRAAAQLDETSRGYLKTIFEAAHQGGHLVDDLLAFSRMGRAELRRSRVDLRALVQEVTRELQVEARGRQVQWQVGALPEVQADPAMLRQVLRNLLANALKYTRPRAEAVIEVGAAREEGEHHVWVRDNGVGFEMRYVDKLFGVFQRLHTAEQFEGTGIGLANVKRVVQRHGGRVWAEGAPERGATFHFTLPTAP